MTLGSESHKNLKERFTANFGEDSPTYGRIAHAVLNNDHVLEIFDDLPEQKRRPVLLFAAVHYLVLRGSSHHLSDLYAAPDTHDAMDTVGDVFIDFVEQHESEVRSIMVERNVQTNEVNRCVGLLPALMYAERLAHKPLSFIDIGTSAGLNLLFDRFRYDYEGGPVIGPPGAAVRLHSRLTGRVPAFSGAAPDVEHRVGIDREPIDISDPDEELWLRACVWVGQVARDQRLTAALELARREWPSIKRGDATTILPDVADDCPPDTEICVFTSWILGWMTKEQRDALALAIADVGRSRKIWWVSLEWPGMVPGLTATSVATNESVLGLECFEPGSVGPKERRILGTIHHHGNWLNWTDADTSAW